MTWTKFSRSKVQNSNGEYQPPWSHNGFFFAISLTICDILILLNFYLQHLGQDHMIEKVDFRNSIANIILHKSHTEHFCASCFRLREITIFNFWPWKFRSKSCGRKLDLRQSITNVNLYKSHMEHFFAYSYVVQDINIWNFWRWQFI